MNITAAASALLGVATIASAQSATLNLTHNDADGVIAIGESVTWTLSIGFDGFEGDAAAAIGNMSLFGNDAVGISTDMAYTPTNGDNNGGTSNGAGIGFVSWVNSIFIEAFTTYPADRSNPYPVGTFGFTSTAEGTVDYVVTLGLAASPFLQIDTGPFTAALFDSEDVTRNIQSLTVREPTVCKADLNGDGILDLGDIQSFLELFIEGGAAADLNGDGFVDDGDLFFFVAIFLQGC